MVLIATFGIAIVGTIFLYFLFEKTRSDVFSRIPGPKGLPIIGALLDFQPANFVRKWEEWAWKYGPIYTFKVLWKRFVIISDMAALQDMLKARPSTFNRGIDVSKLNTYMFF